MLRGLRERQYLGVAALVLLVSVAVFWAFLFGDRLFLFPRVGSDTYVQYWPVDHHLSEFVRKGHFPRWSLGIGLGTPVSLSSALLNPGLAVLYVLPPGAYLPGLAVKAVLEGVAAALAWWLFLRAAGLRGRACVLFPVLFAFNGYLTLWGQHRGFGILFVMAPLVLWSHELMLRGRRRWPLVATLTWFICANVYLFWMFALFFAPFALLRWVSSEPASRPAFRVWLARLAGCGAAAALLSAWTLVPAAFELADSPRTVLGGAAPRGVSGVFPLPVELSAVLRLYGNNVLGTDSGFRGPLNYYELPALYCGLLPLLLLPQVFGLASRRERWALGLGCAFVFAAVASPAAALVFNGFSAVSHRHGFVAVLFLLYATSRAFERLESEGRLNRRRLVATLAVLLLPLACALATAGWAQAGRLPAPVARGFQEAMRSAMPLASADDVILAARREVLPVMIRELGKAALFLVAYAALLYGYSARRRRMIGAALVALTAAEAALMTWPTHNARVTLDRSSVGRKQGYFDDSFEAARKLRESDPSLYRVQKTFNSVFLNDNLIQGYYGTQSYRSVQERSLLEFYRGLGIPLFSFSPTSREAPKYVPGVGSRVMVSTLLGVKYAMTRGPPLTWPGYEPFDRAGDVAVYSNRCALPLGFAYTRQADERTVRGMPDVLRQLALLNACVPAGDAPPAEASLPTWTAGPRESEATALLYALTRGSRVLPSDGHVEWTGPASLSFRPEGEAPRLTFPVEGAHDGAVAVSFDLAFAANTSLRIGMRREGAETAEAGEQVLSVYRGRDHHDLNLFTTVTNGRLCVEFPRVPHSFEIGGVTVRRFPTALYAEAAAERRREGFVVDSFRQDRFAGHIVVDQPGVLCLTIPFNRGWSARRNGVGVPVRRVNFGFVGIPLLRGRNSVEFRFSHPGSTAGWTVSLATGLAIAAGALVRRIRRSRARRSR